MKRTRLATSTLAILLAAASPALAVDTTQVYNSGFLVLAFLGFCALIVVVQLIPAIILMIGSLKSMASGASKKQNAHARAK